MLEKVPIDRLKPNPFRRLEEYPIIREKVDTLKESIAQTGFWGTVVVRPAGDSFEIAFGHHRLVALQESKVQDVEVIVRDLSNEQMIKMMARENMEEWGTSAWVELETVRAVIAAYGRGEIMLPEIPEKTPGNAIRHVPNNSLEHPYTKSSVATFLGWTNKGSAGTYQPNYACETVFKALDAIDKGLLSEKDVKGLKRSQLGETVRHVLAVHEAELKVAERNKKEAKIARERAAEAEAEPERKRLEKKAAVHTMQSEQHEAAAKRNAIRMGQEGANLFRNDRGRDAVKQLVEELKPTVERTPEVHQMDDLARRIAGKLEEFANDDDDLREDYKFLMNNLDDVSPRAIDGLIRSFQSLIDRLERMKVRLSNNTRSHANGTEVSLGSRSISVDGD